MTLVATSPNEIDRKLHRIILDANPSEFTNMMALARSIAREKCVEFSYVRTGKTEHSGATTIQHYISYASEVKLLDGDFSPTKPKKDVRSLESFQQWLSDTVYQYLTDHACAVEQIADKTQFLLQAAPHKLPTPDKIRALIKSAPSAMVFRFSLKIVSILRPKAFQLKTRRIILIPGTLEE